MDFWKTETGNVFLHPYLNHSNSVLPGFLTNLLCCFHYVANFILSKEWAELLVSHICFQRSCFLLPANSLLFHFFCKTPDEGSQVNKKITLFCPANSRRGSRKRDPSYLKLRWLRCIKTQTPCYASIYFTQNCEAQQRSNSPTLKTPCTWGFWLTHVPCFADGPLWWRNT